MEKKKVIIHYNNLPPEVLELIVEQYPDGYKNHVKKITKPNNDFFYAITVDTKEISYLIKVDVKIDNLTEDKLDEALFASAETSKTEKFAEEEMADSESEDADTDASFSKDDDEIV